MRPMSRCGQTAGSADCGCDPPPAPSDSTASPLLLAHLSLFAARPSPQSRRTAAARCAPRVYCGSGATSELRLKRDRDGGSSCASRVDHARRPSSGVSRSCTSAGSPGRARQTTRSSGSFEVRRTLRGSPGRRRRHCQRVGPTRPRLSSNGHAPRPRGQRNAGLIALERGPPGERTPKQCAYGRIPRT